MGFIFIIFVICVGGGWLVGKIFGNALFPDRNENRTYIDRTVHHHHHYHDNRSVHVNGEEFKNLKK